MSLKYDNHLGFKVINLLRDVLLLSILWLIGSLPLITIGASTTALFYVCGKKVQQQKIQITSEFIKSYKQNFKQSFAITIILAVLWFATITYLIMGLSFLNEGFHWSIVFILLLCFETIMMTIYLCALLAKYELRTIQLIRNSFLFTHGYLFESIKAFGITISMLFCLMFIPGLIIILPGSMALSTSVFVKNAIDKYLVRQKAIEELRQEQALQA